MHSEPASTAFTPSLKKISVRSAGSAIVLCLFALFVTGCGGVDEIRRYQAPKPERMLAAIVFDGDSPWTFTVTGPRLVIEEHARAFRELVESVSFANRRPQWTLPEGWRKGPASPMSFATLEFGPKENAMRLAIRPLMLLGSTQTAKTLSNVNQWRGQMGLSPIAEEQLDDETERIELEGTVATLVDLLGTVEPDAMGQPHSPPMMRTVPGPRKPAAAATSTDGGEIAISFEVPETWKPGQREVSRGPVTIVYDAAFKVTDGEQRVDITVNSMPGGGTSLMNVNRWRDQVGLGPIESDQIDQSAEDIEVDGTASKYLEIVGPVESIFIATAVRGRETWYLKLKGTNELASREKEHFQKFLKSIKFR